MISLHSHFISITARSNIISCVFLIGASATKQHLSLQLLLYIVAAYPTKKIQI